MIFEEYWKKLDLPSHINDDLLSVTYKTASMAWEAAMLEASLTVKSAGDEFEKLEPDGISDQCKRLVLTLRGTLLTLATEVKPNV